MSARPDHPRHNGLSNGLSAHIDSSGFGSIRPRLFIVGLVLAGLFLAGCGSRPRRAVRRSADTEATIESEDELEYGLEAEPTKIETIPCEVFTHEPGFLVLVDGVAARTADGKPLLTPCEVGVPSGEHTVTVVKAKFEDTSEAGDISSPRTYDFKPEFAPFALAKGYFASPYTRLKVGEPKSLTNLNSDGKVYDPFLADGGKALFFAGLRSEGKGIYVSRRESLWHDFPVPEFVQTTLGLEVPCSPSVTADGMLLVYGSVGRARIRSVEKLVERFGPKSDLLLGKVEDTEWPVVQISGDGLSLYILQKLDGKRSGLITSRNSTDVKFPAEWVEQGVPGLNPVMSSDSRRQYLFDGKKLKRASRHNLYSHWSKSKVIAELDLPNFKRDKQYRQFHVSEDEQWLYFTDDPATGNLYVVRLSEGPQWGFIPQGKSIPQKSITVAETEPGEDPEAMPEEPEMTPAESGKNSPDPRNTPLPYTALQIKLEGLLKAWNFDGATALIDAALKNPKYEKDREVLGWDKEEIAQSKAFADKIVSALRDLKEGDELRIGLSKVKFIKFTDGVVEYQSGSNTVSKKLDEVQPGDFISIVDQTADKSSAEYQLQLAIFLARVAVARDLAINPRLAKAGAGGKAFDDRRAQRKVHLVRREIERDNVPAAIKLIAELEKSPGPEGKAEAAKLYSALYARIQWEPISDRKWSTPSPGEFIATTPTSKTRESFLMSDREFENFELSLEWQATDIAQGGVFFHYERGSEISKALQVHLGNDAGANADRFVSGSLFGKIAPKLVNVKPEGMWNTLVMRVEKQTLKVKINGADVLNAPIPPRETRGYVCLDGEFSGISYRKVLVYELIK